MVFREVSPCSLFHRITFYDKRTYEYNLRLPSQASPFLVGFAVVVGFLVVVGLVVVTFLVVEAEVEGLLVVAFVVVGSLSAVSTSLGCLGSAAAVPVSVSSAGSSSSS